MPSRRRRAASRPERQPKFHTRLVIGVMGEPVTGKSTLSERIAHHVEELTGVRPEVFRTDDYGAQHLFSTRPNPTRADLAGALELARKRHGIDLQLDQDEVDQLMKPGTRLKKDEFLLTNLRGKISVYYRQSRTTPESTPDRTGRYGQMANDLESHWARRPDIPAIIVGPKTEEEMQQLMERSRQLDQPVLIEGTFGTPEFRQVLTGPQSRLKLPVQFLWVKVSPGKAGLETRQEWLREARLKGEERYGSEMTEELLAKNPDRWKIDQGPDTKNAIELENIHGKEHLDQEARRIAEQAVRHHSAPKTTRSEILSTLRAIERRHDTPQARLEALLHHLRERYGFDHEGSVSLLALMANPARPSEYHHLKFLRTIDTENHPETGQPVAVDLTDSDAFREKRVPLVTTSNTAAAHLGGQPVRVLSFRSAQTDPQAHDRLAGENRELPESQYFPSGRPARSKAEFFRMYPTANYVPHRMGHFSFYPKSDRTMHMYNELRQYFQHGGKVINRWWHQYWQQTDQSASSIPSLIEQVDRIENANSYTRNHSRRVAAISAYIGRKMGLKSHQLAQLEAAARLHEVQKIPLGGRLTRVKDPLSEEGQHLIEAHNFRIPQMLLHHAPDHPIVQAIRQRRQPAGVPWLFVRHLNGDEEPVEHLGAFAEPTAAERRKLESGQLSSEEYAQSVQSRFQDAYQKDDEFKKMLERGMDFGTLDAMQMHGLGHGLLELTARPLETQEAHLFSRIIDAAKFWDRHATTRGVPLDPSQPGLTRFKPRQIRERLTQAVQAGDLDAKVAAVLSRATNADITRWYQPQTSRKQRKRTS